jgi:3',5'-cyclic AMP phosphodiesterase CpdA
LETLVALKPQPDLVFATGDLVEHGDIESYRQLREMLAALPFPVHYAMGNHDDRANFSAVFPETPLTDGFVQYAVEGFPLRFLVLDTLDAGHHGGAFCPQRAAWLTARLDEAPDTPTLILLHHPPAAIGIDWMDPTDGEEWIERLATTLAGRDNIVGLVSGHVHRAATLDWRGMKLSVTPSTAPSIALDLTEVDPEQPDDRPMIEAGEPGFALHLWTGGRLVSHFAAPEARTIARYTAEFQPLVREIYAGR